MFINNFDPVAIQIFSLEIRWYSLSYIFGILFAWIYCKKILIDEKKITNLFDDLISYLIVGIIIGGRLGYVLFYNLKYYLNNLIEIPMVWQGGMSFHGGLIGVFIATIIFLLMVLFDLKFYKIMLRILSNQISKRRKL